MNDEDSTIVYVNFGAHPARTVASSEAAGKELFGRWFKDDRVMRVSSGLVRLATANILVLLEADPVTLAVCHPVVRLQINQESLVHEKMSLADFKKATSVALSRILGRMTITSQSPSHGSAQYITYTVVEQMT